MANTWGGFTRVGDFDGDGKHDIFAPADNNMFVHTPDKTQFRTKAW
ncbi:MAG TPA: hypothetical protein ACFCUY_11490 [Xenococcaceae cyanobacterium]